MKISLLILALLTNSLMASAQSRIGSGDQGPQGLLAASTRQIIPGDEVVISPPLPNNNDRILVMVDEDLKQENRNYCVVVLKKIEGVYRYGSVDFADDPKMCNQVGAPIFLKGDFNLAVRFSGSVAFYEKKANEELVIKLSKIKIPQRAEISYSKISRDLTEDSELNKLLFNTWLTGGSVSALMSEKELEEYINGNYSLLRKFIRTLPDGEISMDHQQVHYSISRASGKGGTFFALPGTYKITWHYTNGSSQTTTGIVLK